MMRVSPAPLFTACLLACSLLALLCGPLVHAAPQPTLTIHPSTVYPSQAVNHLEPVTAFRIKHEEMHLASPNVRTVDGHLRSLPDQLTVEFSAFGEDHSYELEIVSVFAPYTSMTVHGENGAVDEVQYNVRTYRRMEANGDWVVATIMEDGTMQAAISRGGNLLSVDPLAVHQRELHSSVFHQLSAAAEHGMVAYRGEDMLLDGENLHQCAEAPLNPENEVAERPRVAEPLNFTASNRGPVRRLLAVDAWTDCRSPWVALKFLSGVAVDFGFYKAVGASTAAVNAYLSQMYATMNSVFLQQLNVFLYIDQAIVNTAGGTGTYGWNQDRTSATCPTINSLLTTFTNWRATSKPTTQGVWHLLTDCYPPPGTVGLAYVGALCSKNYGSGVSSYSSSTWLTVAHELGHNFGASHTFQNGQGTTGGIMDYGNGKLNGEYQFHRTLSQSEMCTQVTNSLKTTSRPSSLVSYAACWASYAPVCGNGVVEDGEACDDAGASGCCTSSCQFTAGSQCTSGECCNACKFAASSNTCGGGSGYCSNGQCTTAFCSSYGLAYCGTQPANACKQMCVYNGQCNTMAGFTSNGQPLPVGIPNGVTCSQTPFSTCQSSTCASAATSVTYSWVNGVYGACSASCGGGSQTRTVVCQDSNGNAVASNLCTGTAPASSQACSTAACGSLTYAWSRGAFGTCTNTCGGGTQTASVTCVASNGATVANSLCTGAPPASSQVCNTAACSYAWATSAWSACSRSCGSGSRTRTVACVSVQNGGYTIVANSFCPSGSRPASSQLCNTRRC